MSHLTETIPCGRHALTADINTAKHPIGLVVFAHGSGSSRMSPRNLHVAAVLGDAGLSTVLFDLLTPAESRDRASVFDLGLLSARLVSVLRWLETQPRLAALPVGLFGASTGAAAALMAATAPGVRVSAVVSRGGRPDLAPEALRLVRAPTLFIVGADDLQVLELNREAARQLRCEHELLVVPGATHLFEEAGALDAVATAAAQWFTRHLSGLRETVRASS